MCSASEPVGPDDWRAEAERTLRGRKLADLISATRDGIEIQPLYTAGPDRPAAAAAAADPRRTQQGWDIRQRHLVAAATAEGLGEVRQRIEDDLAGGITSVELDFAADVDVDADVLDRVLSGVDMAATPVALVPHTDLALAEALLAVAERRGGALAAGSSLGLDPVVGCPTDLADAASWAAAAGVRLFAVDAVRYADAGATEAQTLGWATAVGIAYLRALGEAGLSVDAAAGLIGFRLPATADQFVAIASLRAARVMWTRAVTASGGSPEAARQYQHAVTAPHMYSREDPWVNLLRGAAAVLAAGVGGADAVTVLPLDHAAEVADIGAALGRRLARNTQLLMLEESHLARTSDPAGGSFYVESLTEQLAEEGWRVLQAVESSGGMAEAVGRGELEAAMAESRRTAGTAARRW